ncbi:class F sortase [Rugosimonospora africana]|uniref:Sortase family protein n=1 Tax=Rugosimonospora africana TaxID=556532 RepID=A0A8J3QNV6_9ACTN|nr:class F sortase [Rugosimonospora africana]GIH14640.1 hypothetical protein Raf01_28120 [Rugosimonospora africana]
MDRRATDRRASRLRDHPVSAALVAALGIALLVSLPAGPQTTGAAPATGPDDRGQCPPGARSSSACAPPAPHGGCAFPSRPGSGCAARDTLPRAAGPDGADPASGPSGAPPDDGPAGPPPTGGARPGVLPTAVAAGLPATSAPERLRIPGIGVDAPLETLHLLPDGSLAAPRAWGDAGWYADGTRPGDIGPAVIAGHIDSTRGPAVFFRLDDLRVGALIEVERAGQWLSFRAVSVAEYPKNAFPSAKVYGPTPDAQLRLITCGGGFDRRRGSYRDNIVVFAVGA